MWSAVSGSCHHGFPTMMDYVIELHSVAIHNCHLNSPFRLMLLILSHRHRRDHLIQRSTTMRIFGLYTVQDADPWLYKSSQSIPGQVSSIIIMSVATFIIFTSSNISPTWPNEVVHCNHEWRKQKLFHPFTLFISRNWHYAFKIVHLCYSEPASMV